MITRRTVIGLMALGASLGPVLARRAFARSLAESGVCSLWPDELRVEWLSTALGVDTRRPRFTWKLVAVEDGLRNLEQRAWRLIVASSEAAVRAGQGDVWDSGERQAAAGIAVPDQDLSLAPQTPFFWAARVWDQAGRPSAWSEPAGFTTGLFGAAQWRAKWIAAEPDIAAPAPSQPQPAINTSRPVAPQPMPLLRREFEIAKPLRHGIISVSGLGQYELRINGHRAGAGVLEPGWTDYRKTVLYNTLDVTSLMRDGPNVIGVLLGNGLFDVEKYTGRYTKFTGKFGQPKLILQLRLAFEDGSEAAVVSDASWRTRSGPIVCSSIYGGEDFDARLEPEGWDLPGGSQDDGVWVAAIEVQGPGGALRAQTVPPVTVAQTLAPVAVTRPKPGVTVYDLGRNFSGWPAIAVRGSAGRKIKLLPGELLDSEGLVTQRSANARPGNEISFTYTLRGNAEERWRPRFSYSGFRYVQLEGASAPDEAAPGEPVLISLEGEFLHANLPEAGRFDSSDTLIVRVHELIKQALLSNTYSVLTDCPHREKLGWLEQTHLNADTVFYNEDAVTLYEKMLRDMRDSQLENGLVPEIAPEYVAFLDTDGTDSLFRDSPEWGAAIVLSPWAAYRYTGDRRILEEGYAAMVRYAEYLAGKVRDGLLDYGLGDWYDIGPQPPGVSQLTTQALTATATYCQMLLALSKIAHILGRGADAVRYSKRATSARDALNTKLFDRATNRYDRGSMTANAMPLAIGLVSKDRRAAVLDNLVADIRAHHNHVTAGDVGFHYVVLALMENGRGDVLYDILSRADSPSYGSQLVNGATALTEAWDTNPDKSQNHFILGHAESWLFGGLAGIRIDMSQPLEARIRIAPQAVAGVNAASARYRCMLGDVGSAWRKRNGRLYLQAQVPPGSRAQIILPGASPAAITESGAALSRTRGVLRVRAKARPVTITVGSGHYEFESPVD